jgi:hypothetical protein
MKWPGNDLFEMASCHISTNSSMTCLDLSIDDKGRYSTFNKTSKMFKQYKPKLDMRELATNLI